ncbi:MAG: SHOCT domain-containing protein, partial [Acidimicrobiales bacterium]
MPGLLRGVARTAVIAGTATAVSNRVSRRQANRWASQEDQQYAQQQQYAQEQYAQQQYAQ